MTIGILVAEDQEMVLLQQAISCTQENHGKFAVFCGDLHGHRIVLVCAGVGKVNAAACTQLLISVYHVDCLINTGTAGGLLPSLAIFDLVLSSDAVQYDVDATEFGYTRGQVPGTDSLSWQADTKLISIMEKAFGQCKKKYPYKMAQCNQMVLGRVASGDTFVSEEALRNEIISIFNPACVEMEGAACAQVAHNNNIPFIILRSISDTAGKNAPALFSYKTFSKIASSISAGVILEALSLMAE